LDCLLGTQKPARCPTIGLVSPRMGDNRAVQTTNETSSQAQAIQRPAQPPHYSSTESRDTNAATGTTHSAMSQRSLDSGQDQDDMSPGMDEASPDGSVKSSSVIKEEEEGLDYDSIVPESSSANNQSMPVQKRRRVTRACDECRRKKIKCDGKQPCTHCSVYSYGKPCPPPPSPFPLFLMCFSGGDEVRELTWTRMHI
jgi:hypothetical protein